MERKEVVAARADIARKVSSLMSRPQFYRDLVEMGGLDEDGDVPMVVAGEDESATLTLHRLESLNIERVILATTNGPTTIHMVGLLNRESDEPSESSIDLIGGMTVRDWLDMAKTHPGSTYTASGTDIFIPSADSSLYSVAGVEADFSY